MLVVTRRDHETIKVGDDITITIIRGENGRTRVGIEAPREVPVHRGEVYQKILTSGRKDERHDRTNPNRAA